jgi:predicted short-subunit dehydrogenase-like oxidoreductase (DUF2520 family)
MKAVIIGSGNVATHLALAFQKKGIIISQVYSRTSANAELLAQKLNTSFTTHTSGIDRNADIYIYALKDSSFLNLLKRFDLPKAIHVHTSGSIPMKDFYGYTDRYGVLYPLQTFSINKEIDFSNVPICIEANSEKLENELIELAKLLTTKTYILSSEQRRKVHLAAVFACNFTNYMYDIAHDIVLGAGIEFDILKPLIMETADKINTLSPREAQTGPAIRYDENIINKHLIMLDNRKHWKAIYRKLTKNIHNRHAKKKDEGFFKKSINLFLRKVRYISAKFRKQ